MCYQNNMLPYSGFGWTIENMWMKQICRFMISDILESHLWRKPLLYLNTLWFQLSWIWGKYQRQLESRWTSVVLTPLRSLDTYLEVIHIELNRMCLWVDGYAHGCTAAVKRLAFIAFSFGFLEFSVSIGAATTFSHFSMEEQRREVYPEEERENAVPYSSSWYYLQCRFWRLLKREKIKMCFPFFSLGTK